MTYIQTLLYHTLNIVTFDFHSQSSVLLQTVIHDCRLILLQSSSSPDHKARALVALLLLSHQPHLSTPSSSDKSTSSPIQTALRCLLSVTASQLDQRIAELDNAGNLPIHLTHSTLHSRSSRPIVSTCAYLPCRLSLSLLIVIIALLL